MNAVNMDTGYVNYLSDSERQDVLCWTREALGAGVPFVAGGLVRGGSRGGLCFFRKEKDGNFRFRGLSPLFQKNPLHSKNFSLQCAGSWAMWRSVLRFPLTNIPPRCFCISLGESRLICHIRRIQGARRGKQKFFEIVRSGSVIEWRVTRDWRKRKPCWSASGEPSLFGQG